MIRSFKCKHTQKLYEGGDPREFRAFKSAAERKLAMLNSAETIEFLRSPPGNHLEKLTGNRENQWSIRINNQWRICFEWYDGDVHQVEIVDYH